MRRFALFVAAFVVIVAIGSQPRHGASLSNKSMCVCIPARAGLMMKSAIAKTQARSTQLFTSIATVAK